VLDLSADERIGSYVWREGMVKVWMCCGVKGDRRQGASVMADLDWKKSL
jgi:hypothetical protein